MFVTQMLGQNPSCAGARFLEAPESRFNVEHQLHQDIARAISVAILAKANFRAMDRQSVQIEDFDAFIALSNALGDAKKALAADLARIPDEDFALKSHTGGRQLILTKSAQRAGAWQLTRFANDGLPWGDTNYPTKSQAIKKFVSECELGCIEGSHGLFLTAQSLSEDDAEEMLLTVDNTAPAP